MNERLYGLVPAIYRRRDAELGEPLRALMAVLERELDRLEDDTAALYRDWFIETCAEWVVPYVGDLLGVRGIREARGDAFTMRGYVANTLRYRRRKGTAAVLEALARDVTGWPARAVEFFQRLDTTQHVNHVRLGYPRTRSIRDPDPVGLTDGAFGDEVHTAEVRDVDARAGRYNIPNVGLFLWRLGEHEVERATARPAGSDGDLHRFTFDPAGLDAPLFNHPAGELDVAHLADERNVPGPLRPHAVIRALADFLADPADPRGAHYFGDEPVFEVFADGAPIPPEGLRVFAPWRRDDPAQDAALSDWDAIRPGPGLAAVDVERGRLVLHRPGADPPAEVTVSYSYGFSADIGAGPYDRTARLALPAEVDVHWQRGVSREIAAEPGVVESTLGAAIAAWNEFAQDRWATLGEGTTGIIAILDSRTYAEPASAWDIQLPPYSELLVVAADWPLEPPVDLPPGSPLVRMPGRLRPTGRRPHLRGTVRVTGASDSGPGGAAESRSSLHLDGLYLDGSVIVAPGDLGALAVSHATIIPARGGLIVEPPGADPATTGNIGLSLSLERTLCGAITAPDTVLRLDVTDSVVDAGDAGGGSAITAPGAHATVAATTCFGAVAVKSLDAADSIFDGLVRARRRQIGCVRYSYIAVGSRTPRRFRCQPELAVRRAPPGQAGRIERRLVPAFVSRVFGHPGYAQLARVCPLELREGGEDGAEMGVFHLLEQPRREANLRAAVAQYPRAGLRVGLLFAT